MSSVPLSRQIGTFPDSSSPRLVLFAGVHGNEPSGVVALRRVFNQLREESIVLQGAVVGVLGNIEALQRKVRYVQEDLNRLFLPSYIEQVKAIPSGHTAEARELLELIQRVEFFEARAQEKPFFVDCHTTSSDSIPYISLNDGFDDSYRFAKDMPATAVIGVEKEIPGCLSEWLNLRGWHGFTFEAGQHDAMRSVQNQEAIIWLALLHSGCLPETHAPAQVANARSTLRQQGTQYNKTYRAVSSYRIREDEQFRMEPGFVNLQEVSQGQLLAHSDGAPLYADQDGHILMPLYQKQGNFGYFMAQEVEMSL